MSNNRSIFTVLLTALTCISFIFSQAAFSYTDAEIDSMFKALKAENEALKREIQALKEAKGTRLTQTPVKSRSNTETLSYVRQSIEDQRAFNISGFLTAGMTNASPTNIADQNVAIDDDTSFDTDSILGLQTSFRLTERADVTAQLTAKGLDDFQLEADWAFLRYQVTDRTSFRAGKLRLPLYLFSESLEVGFSYPWVRPPQEVYQIPIFNYEGVDSIFTLPVNDWVHKVQVFMGEDSGDTYDTNTFIGGNITSFYDAWTFRLSAYRYDVTIKESDVIPATPFASKDNKYFTFATNYDDGNWLFISEISAFEVPDDTPFFRSTDAGYITVGKYFGKLLPHFTYAKTYSKEEPDLQAILSRSFSASELDFFNNRLFANTDPTIFTGESYTLGLRYSLAESSSIKLEWKRYTDMDGTASIWNRLRLIPNLDEPLTSTGIDDINVYSLAIDTVF